MAFSVLMSVYKKERPEYLREAVESVFAQSLVPDEVVLMEDGPLTEELYQMIATLEKRYPALQGLSTQRKCTAWTRTCKGRGNVHK